MAVEATCGGIWAEAWYCVGIPRAPAIKPTTTTASATVQTQTSTQRPLQQDCHVSSSLLTVPTTALVRLRFVTTITTGLTVEPEDPRDCNPSAPPQAQPSAICGCKKWHKVVEGDTCGSVVTEYQISHTQLDTWNPTINNGRGWKTMWSDYSTHRIGNTDVLNILITQ